MGTKTTTPNAAAIIFNYRDRIAAEGTDVDKVNKVDQIVLNTLSLISIATTKTKSAPQGTFQLTLAPTKNWVTVLTPGSWVVLLMSQNKITEEDLPSFNRGGRADPNKVKFLGRIDSVRANTGINQKTGARETTYIVTGFDWGNVFTSILYVDPLAKFAASASALGAANAFLFQNMTLDLLSDNLPTSDQNVQAIKKLWGSSVGAVKDIKREVRTAISDSTGGQSDIIVKPDSTFVMPDQLVKYMNFNTSGKNIADIIEVIGSKVKRKNAKVKGDTFNGVFFDEYDPVTEAVGIIQSDSIFGQNQFWQLINDNCNSAINEVLCDIRWNDNKRPSLALYKRIKPFIFRDNFLGSEEKVVADLVSKYTDLRTVEIPLDDIITANAGTNWRDKYNFIEILFDQSLSVNYLNQQIKSDVKGFAL